MLISIYFQEKGYVLKNKRPWPLFLSNCQLEKINLTEDFYLYLFCIINARQNQTRELVNVLQFKPCHFDQ